MKYRFDEAQVGALWINNSATASSGITHIYNDSTDNQKLKIGRSNILGNNVAMSIDREGTVSGSFTGSFGGDGSAITGVTAEWDGTRDGDAEITGSLIVTEEVGIGTSTPDEVLHIKQSEASTGYGHSIARIEYYATDGFADGDGCSIKFAGGDAASANNVIGRLTVERDGADNEGAFAFSCGTNGAEEFMKIDSAGNVGIGTDSPNSKLNIMKSGDGSKLLSFNESVNAEVEFGFYGNFAGSGPTGNKLYLGSDHGGWSSNMTTWRGDGNVGIGISDPQVYLDVVGSNDDKSLQLRSGDSSAGTDAVQVIFSYNGKPYNDEGYAHSIRTRHHSDQAATNAIDFYLWTNADSDDALGSNRVMTLDGDGSISLYGLDYTAGTNYMRYHTTTGRVTYLSSKKEIKTNIKNLKKSDGISIINQLRPVTFEMKNERGNIKTGFVAEEVGNVAGSLVSYGLDYKHHKTTGEILTGSDGKKIVKSDKLVPQMWEFEAVIAHLVKAAQQQSSSMEKLKKEIEKLKKSNTP